MKINVEKNGGKLLIGLVAAIFLYGAVINIASPLWVRFFYGILGVCALVAVIFSLDREHKRTAGLSKNTTFEEVD